MDSNDSTVVERAVRTSLTLRKIRCLPCTCGEYSIYCEVVTRGDTIIIIIIIQVSPSHVIQQPDLIC